MRQKTGLYVPHQSVGEIAAIESRALWAAQDVLYAEQSSPKFERAALKWLARYLEENSPTLERFAKIVSNLARCQDA